MSEETRQIESNKDGFWYHVRSYTSEKMDESFVNEIAYMMVTLHRTGA